MFLHKEKLRELIEKENLISGYRDIDEQLTANGFDVRCCAIIEVKKGGRLAVKKENNRPPVLGVGYVLKGFEDRVKNYSLENLVVVGDETPVVLSALKPYLVISCEEINNAKQYKFSIAPRSSLFRLSQTVLSTAFGEAGYTGFLTFMLVPISDGSEIELGVCIAQVAFAQLTGEADYTAQKFSLYQGGKLF